MLLQLLLFLLLLDWLYCLSLLNCNLLLKKYVCCLLYFCGKCVLARLCVSLLAVDLIFNDPFLAARCPAVARRHKVPPAHAGQGGRCFVSFVCFVKVAVIVCVMLFKRFVSFFSSTFLRSLTRSKSLNMQHKHVTQADRLQRLESHEMSEDELDTVFHDATADDDE